MPASRTEEFKTVVQEVWDELDNEKVINPQFDSFRRRIDVLERFNGRLAMLMCLRQMISR
jgi:hypothetical protein